MIERKSFVYFKSLFDHLELKLNRLAVVYASQKNFNDGKYFRYYKIIIYQFRGFSIFLEILMQGEIDVFLVSRIDRSGSELGKYKNKNLVFKIRKDKINCLFEKIYFLDRDLSNFSTFHEHTDFLK